MVYKGKRRKLEEDINALWLEYKTSENLEARDSIIEYYLPLVEKIARKVYSQKRAFLSSDLDLEDLISIGTIGLIKAVDNFDPEKGTRFESYAYRTIYGYVINYISSKMPISTKSYRSLKKRIEKNWDVNPEKAKEELRNLIHGIALAKLISLETAITSDGELKIADRIADNYWLSPQILMENREFLNKVKKLLENLTKLEKTVVVKYYYEDMKFIEIAKVLGVSRQRVSQLHSSAIRKLRRWLKEIEEK